MARYENVEDRIITDPALEVSDYTTLKQSNLIKTVKMVADTTREVLTSKDASDSVKIKFIELLELCAICVTAVFGSVAVIREIKK